MELVGATTKDMSSHPLSLTALAGQAVDKITQMVGAHSNYLLQSRVRREEAAGGIFAKFDSRARRSKPAAVVEAVAKLGARLL